MTNAFEQITAISTAIIGVSLVTLIVFLIIAANRARTAGKHLEETVQRTVEDLKQDLKPLLGDLRPLLYDLRPLVERGKDISEDVAGITRSIRGNVEAVSETVMAANERALTALAAAEERLAELDALIAVVQSEAENIFVSAASAVYGVKGGAASLRRHRRGTNLASVEAEDDAANDEGSDKEEGDDGIDERPEKESPAPRIRPRAP